MNPSFIPGSHVAVLPGKGVYLRRERGATVLSGPVYERLAPLLDGTRTRDELVGLLAATTTPAEVYFAVDQLITRGYVCEIDSQARIDAGFWSALGCEARAVERLAAATVSLTALGDVDGDRIAAALGDAGVQPGSDGRLTLVVTSDYLHPALGALNLAALSTGRPWLLCKPTGSVLWVGPLFEPGASACWECLAQRLRRHRPLEAYLQTRTGAQTPPTLPRAMLPGTEMLGLHLAALQVAKFVAGAPTAGSTHEIVTLDLATLAIARHVVVRRPQCPACGHPLRADRAPAPPVLDEPAPLMVTEGGYRTRTADATLQQYQHHISPISGIVGALRPLAIPSDPDGTLHVYRAGRNLAVPVDTPELLDQVLRNRSAGKGVTDAQARASGLCESLERYSGMFTGDEPRIRSSYRSLGGRAIHPNACLLFSERQYAMAEPWRLGAPPYRSIPAPFDEDAVMDWSPLWSLTSGTYRYLPTAYCYYAHPALEQVRTNPPDSNGAAAGNTIGEAIVQGFLELVERDAVALWWYNRLARPAVNMESISDPYVEAVRQIYQRLHRDLWALDLTTDLGVPTFAAVSRVVNAPHEAIIFGFGAHFDERIALMRALTEMQQLLPAASGATAPGASPARADATDAMRWWVTATVTTDSYLCPDPAARPRILAEGPPAHPETVSQTVQRCRALAERHQLELLVQDQTRPDVGLPVVKVVVPGLRHFWPRFAPGRLYDVPVQLGWRATATPEHDLNPVALFL